MKNHKLWALNHNTWKFIRKEIRRNKKIGNKKAWTDEQIKRAFPAVGYKQNNFVNVEKDKSPFNGDVVYWGKRKNKLYNGFTADALKKQSFKCGHCGLSFIGDDQIELHHKDGNHNNWKKPNLVALHRGCHQYQEVHSTLVRIGAPNDIEMGGDPYET